VNYLQLFKANTRILSFGILLVFFSSFGQTFVVSLYIPWFLDAFQISSSFFSGLYALATISSAITLIFAGKKIDQVPLRGYTLFVVLGMLAAVLLAAFSVHLLMLFLSIYLLRFFGQGLLSHTAMTTMARYFSKARGKALSVAYLGFPMGEGLLPALTVSSILWVGWRETLGLTAMLIVFLLLPLALWLIRGFVSAKVVETPTASKYHSREAKPLQAAKVPSDFISEDKEQGGKLWRQREVFRSPFFLFLAPSVFLVGFLQTNLFFFQTFIASYKGWTVEWMAISIAAYAISSSLCSIAAGPLIDRFSAVRLFPFVLIPMGLGISVLSLTTDPVMVPVYWLLIGISGGVSSPVNSSLYAELFGVKSLGAVRSLFTFVMVISTALGPVTYSFLLDSGLNFDQIHWGMLAAMLLNLVWIWRYSKRLKKR
jgi:MFS family permease